MNIISVLFPVLLAVLILLREKSQCQAALTAAVSSLSSGTYGCDLYSGRWAYSLAYVPYYRTKQCPFIESQFNCRLHGRPDSYYLNYRWLPDGCVLPRFNGVDFLSKMRGKRLMFVGDSLGLNQWQSLTCMLHVAAPTLRYRLTKHQGLSTFFFPAYNASLMFSRNAFLVDIVRSPEGPVLLPDSIGSGKLWEKADVLIFNSWHWWLHTGRKQPWKMVEEGDQKYSDMNRLVLYEKALNTWARWVDANVNSDRTRVFFQGVSPDHTGRSPWGGSRSRGCEGQMTAFRGRSYPGGAHPAESILERVLRSMVKPVYLLNITSLSQLRKDGHPSIYGDGGHNQRDCSHWCLAGVPDTWNELLYASLL